MQELFDEVYVGKDHTPTAVSFKLQFVKGVTRKAEGEKVNRRESSGYRINRS
jgi:hypothetical protein